MAIRSAVGARAGALVRHVLATGGWVVAAGLGSGAVLALVVHRVAARVAEGVLAADAAVWIGVLLLLMAVCAAAFVAPALRTVRLDVSRALQVELRDRAPHPAARSARGPRRLPRLDEPRAPWRIHAGLPSDGDAGPGLPILLRMPNDLRRGGLPV